MSSPICILGSGANARQIAANLLPTGQDILIASEKPISNSWPSSSNSELEVLQEARLISGKGSVGGYRLVFARGEETLARDVSGIILAENGAREPSGFPAGLIGSERVLPLSTFKKALNGDGLPENVTTVAFLIGLAGESNPIICEEMMQACLDLQSRLSIQTYVLTDNLKVAGEGLEALYRKTKEAGTFFMKLTGHRPEISRQEDGIAIEFADEVTGYAFKVTPDLVVADESILPPSETQGLSEILRLDLGRDGFAQADNVHRLPVQTNRTGVLSTGFSRGILNRECLARDADLAAMAAISLPQKGSVLPEDRALIDTNACVKCLTCYRTCPHAAIVIDARISVVPEACERCGICAVECPRGAISIKGFEVSGIPEKSIRQTSRAGEHGDLSIIAFCCSRSASKAGELASLMRHRLPSGLQIMEVPCAGGISYANIFAAFLNRADGVLLLTCHEGNCHSEYGNVFARRKADYLQTLFPALGLAKERLAVRTLSSNMGKDFAEIVNGFEDTLRNLGPLQLIGGETMTQKQQEKRHDCN
ncbi:MAG: hydrogenase iron-sulfur subunit [Desulfohalobiaceae bacterium]|nr:hydrogenase iron-sulfur subunit [Desulfohalobiaceae bacterium]